MRPYTRTRLHSKRTLARQEVHAHAHACARPSARFPERISTRTRPAAQGHLHFSCICTRSTYTLTFCTRSTRNAFITAHANASANVDAYAAAYVHPHPHSDVQLSNRLRSAPIFTTKQIDLTPLDYTAPPTLAQSTCATIIQMSSAASASRTWQRSSKKRPSRQNLRANLADAAPRGAAAADEDRGAGTRRALTHTIHTDKWTDGRTRARQHARTRSRLYAHFALLPVSPGRIFLTES
eukprot:442505-Pleurochrysis_carterae.AAC.1